MNERIKELIKQHGLNITIDGLGYGEGNVEGLAELIVRECIDIVSPYAVRMENFDGGHPIADLKKHFGVEECISKSMK